MTTSEVYGQVGSRRYIFEYYLLRYFLCLLMLSLTMQLVRKMQSLRTGTYWVYQRYTIFIGYMYCKVPGV